MSIYDVFSGGNRPFDKEEWAAAKQAQRKEAYELIDNTCSEMWTLVCFAHWSFSLIRKMEMGETII
ncbi:hypothetical protein GT565_14320, partial [Dorea longicatena]|nr:hypothetical protein [Dorea longicatena]